MKIVIKVKPVGKKTVKFSNKQEMLDKLVGIAADYVNNDANLEIKTIA